MKILILFLLLIYSAFSAEYIVTKIKGETIWVKNDRNVVLKFKLTQPINEKLFLGKKVHIKEKGLNTHGGLYFTGEISLPNK